MNHPPYVVELSWDDTQGFISPLAVIGQPPEHREYRWKIEQGERSYLRPVVNASAIVEALVTIDGGLERPTYVGERAFLMKHSHVGHDAYIGANVNLAPGAIVGGHCKIGNGAKIGLGASIRPRVLVGHGAVIGAGAVVVKDVPAGAVWAGNPAGQLRSRASRPLPVEWANSADEYDAWMEWYELAHGGTPLAVVLAEQEGEG